MFIPLLTVVSSPIDSVAMSKNEPEIFLAPSYIRYPSEKYCPIYQSRTEPSLMTDHRNLFHFIKNPKRKQKTRRSRLTSRIDGTHDGTSEREHLEKDNSYRDKKK